MPLRRTSLSLAVVALSLAGSSTSCRKAAPPLPGAGSPGAGDRRVAQPAAGKPESHPTSGNSGALAGKVVEAMNASRYTYLRIETQAGSQWAAVPEAEVKVGDTVSVIRPMLMSNFHSKALKRTFKAIYFGRLGKAAAGATSSAPTASQVPAAHPPVGGTRRIKLDKPLAKAVGPTGRRVAEVYAEKAALEGKQVTIRGAVAKINKGILGRNWLHLQDGTGTGKTADLTVTSKAEAAVGDTVLVEGVVRTDKSFGAGYSYDVIVEDATIKVEPAAK